jgi:hypothetical protein
MATNFPTSLDTLGNPSASTPMNDVTYGHAAQHANANDAIEALQAKVGIDSSADTGSLDYKMANHNHDAAYAAIGHDHDASYAAIGHNHDAAYEPIGTAIKQGRHTLWIPAGAMLSRTTSGAASGSTETTTNKVMLKTLDFDAASIEYAQFSIRMPKSWNESTVTFAPTWKHAATTTNFKVSWGLQAVALSNDDAADTSFGTAQYSNDEGGTTDDIYVGPESSAITIAGTPAAEDWVVFQVLRKADDGTNDTLAIDAGLLGVSVYVTLNAATDA